MTIARRLGLLASAFAFTGALAAIASPALAQTAPGYAAPKTMWGAPDLQGFWTNASLTDMQRGPDYPNLVLTKEEVARMEKLDYYNNRFDDEAKASDVNDKRLLDGADLLQGSGYNVFWIDPGSRVSSVRGTFRSSWVTEPADGRIPYKNRPRTTSFSAQGSGGAPPSDGAKPNVSAQASRIDPNKITYAGPSGQAVTAIPRDGGGGSYGSYDGPETRTIADRCLIGFGSTGGPVMTNAIYNNNYQIVQTPTHAMILVEMNHDARIIPIFANADQARKNYRPSVLPQWLGDSVGWYEGNTLVVETTNVNPKQRGNLSQGGKLVEKFSRYDKDELVYEFEVDDPSMYSQVWKGEMSMKPARDSIYEYACHEGNYAMEGILAGARKLEREGRLVEPNAQEEGGGR